MAYFFGSGGLTLGSGGPQVGTLQDVSLDINFNTVTLHGSKQFPVAVARGAATCKGRAKSAEVQGAVIAAVLGITGGTPDTGGTLTNQDMGAGAALQIVWTGSYNGVAVTYTLLAAVLTKYSFAVKNDNFYSADVEFEAFADGSGNVLTYAIA
jgi:hypothetical protein